MRLPRWTVWPALGILFVFAIPGVPWHGDEGQRAPRVVVLGIDGLDPDLLAQFVHEHPERFPNFVWAIGQGGLNRLQTSTPPQSPVAWSNFITGLDPGGHGIFDFIHRDTQTRDVATSVTKAQEPSSIGLGPWQLPLGGDAQSNRTGEAFWQILAEHGISADVWRMPANFPVTASRGWSFSGMMTPAIDSAYGEYHLYTTVPSADAVAGGEKIEFVQRFGDRIDAKLTGPPNPYKKNGERVTLPLEISIDPQAGAALLELAGRPLVLQPCQWSEFVRVSFPLLPAGAGSVPAIVRFYLRAIEPFELYASPLNIDPSDPVTPVSLPKSASAEVARRIGSYYTQGMPEDVNALKDRALTDAEFMQQSNLVHDEGARMLDYALERWNANPQGGFLFFYFSGVDLCSHMLWRHGDARHPAHDEPLAASADEGWTHRPGSTWREALEDVYLRMDPVLGRIRERLPEGALLIVMSDHGFETWRRKFNLDTWLVQNGYLVLEPGKVPGKDTTVQQDVDWSKSRAYGIGFNALYLNLAGREGARGGHPGIVQPGAEAEALLAELKSKLEALRDGDARPIVRVDLAREVYHGARLSEAPDLVVGYNAGYGNSDASTLGRIPEAVFEDNLGGTFNGNHLMAPELVEGTLLTNGKVLDGKHGLEDLTVEILKQFGIQPGKGMRGHPVLR
jgi:predicted AlkP superfamily phosphohydrolase/phosphomutase